MKKKKKNIKLLKNKKRAARRSRRIRRRLFKKHQLNQKKDKRKSKSLKKLTEVELFEKTVRKISFFAFQYGLETSKIKFEEIGIDKAKTDNFFSKCHEGWAIAQKMIVVEILKVEKKQAILKVNLKEARRNREKEIEKEILRNTNFSNFKVAVLRSIGSGIGWTILRGQTHIIRRLFIEESPPTLSTSNLGSVITKVDEINNGNPLEFALIADITNFIQIGDILHKGVDFIQYVEMKEGQKNIEAKKILDNIIATKKSIEEVDKIVEDKKMNKQVKRMFRQVEKGNRAIEVMKNDEGIDPLRGEAIKLVEPDFLYEDYNLELLELIEKCNKEHHAYNVIDDCVLIGAYSHEHKFKGEFIIQAIIKQLTGKNYPVTNLVQLISIPTVQPIFSKPLGIENTMNIIFDRIRVSICIDFDRLIELFNSYGAEAKWLTPRQTQKIGEYKGSSHGMFVFNNQAISIKYNGTENRLGNGIIARILFDNLKPTSAVGMFLSTMK